MSVKRTIQINSNGSHLSLSLRQLVVSNKEGELGRVPIEDIGVLIVDSHQATLTSALMDALSGAGCALMTCDASHHPSGLLLPLSGNSLHTERLQAQVNMSQPLRKQLWKRLVESKIRNQAAMLGATSTRSRLERLADEVKSGDSTNREAVAAKFYWSEVFLELPGCEDFSRRRDGLPPNNLLNYGYAILRACVARAICGTGLHPAIGLHHHNRYNPFCLADDLMEPFRPCVDSRVVDLVEAGEIELTKEVRTELLGILTDRVAIEEATSPLMVAVEKVVNSLAAIASKFEGSNREEETRASAPTLAQELRVPAILRERAETESRSHANQRVQSNVGICDVRSSSSNKAAKEDGGEVSEGSC